MGCGPAQVPHIPRLFTVYYCGMSGKELERCMAISTVYYCGMSGKELERCMAISPVVELWVRLVMITTMNQLEHNSILQLLV